MVLQTADYQPCMYRRQRQNANIGQVGQYATLQVSNLLCIGDKDEMPIL